MAEPTIRVVPPGPDRDTYLPLLHSADDSADQVHSYYQTGTLFALDELDSKPIGMILAIARPDGAVELKAVAVDAWLHGQGVGTRLLLAVLERLRASGVRRVIVGISSSGIGPPGYYQKAGFRLSKIERDFFSPERGYPGDMVWMDKDHTDIHAVSTNRSIGRDHGASLE